MAPTHRTRSDRFRCPDCGNRNESRLCVLGEDTHKPAHKRQIHCDECRLTAPAPAFVPHAKLQSRHTDPVTELE